MGHRTISVALVLGLISLPLACGGDDDDDGGSGGTAGTAGSSGKGGSAGKGGAAGKGGSGGTAGKGGGAGSAGKGGSAGSGGTSAGASGEAGSGNAGGEAGASAGAGGQAGDGAGAGGQSGAGLGGAGGEGGQASDPDAERLARCLTMCNLLVDPDDDGTTEACTGDANECALDYCNTTGFSIECVDNLDELLDCLEAPPANMLYCREPVEGEPQLYDNTVGIDFAADSLCPAVFVTRGNCISATSED